MRCLVMAGGTGGHILPGLAVADALREKGYVVAWLGSEHGLEGKLVPEAGYEFYPLPVKAIRGKSLKAQIQSFFRLLNSFRKAVAIIRKWDPDWVVGLGGFSAGPGGLAAAVLRKPLFIHEQNARMGWTNRFLSRLAKKTFLGFPLSDARLKRTECIGNPVRQSLRSLPSPHERWKDRSGPLRILIMGGSLGAKFINQEMPQILSMWKNQQAPAFEIWHQTGASDVQQVQEAYQAANIPARVAPFIQDMREAYGWADLAIARAGALTVSELAVVGLGSLLIPYPHAVDDHQTLNAKSLVQKGAAVCVQQAQYQRTEWVSLLQQMESRQVLLKMAEDAKAVDAPDPVQRLITQVEAILHASR